MLEPGLMMNFCLLLLLHSILSDMTTVFEYLLEHRDEFACTACGKCCHGFKRPCKQLVDGKHCAIHPSVTGVDRREEIELECNADVDTFEALHIGYLCPPMMDAIVKLVGVTLEPDRVRLSPLTGEHIFVDRAQLDRVYNMKI